MQLTRTKGSGSFEESVCVGCPIDFDWRSPLVTSWTNHRTASGQFFDLGLKVQVPQHALLLKIVADARRFIG